VITLNSKPYFPDEFRIFNETSKFYKENPHIMRPNLGWHENICLNEKFLFIQVPKTASSSMLTSFLKQQTDFGLDLLKFVPFHKHIGLPFIESYFKISKELPIFAMCRNPFSQVLSTFLHLYRRNEITHYDSNCWPMDVILCFEEWCKKNMRHPMVRQSSLIKSAVPRHITVFKHEEGVHPVINYFNQSFNLNLDPYLHNINTSKDSFPSVKEFYRNKELRDFVIFHRHEEFKDFQYSTDINKI
jgi:hypothetical protein